MTTTSRIAGPRRIWVRRSLIVFAAAGIAAAAGCSGAPKEASNSSSPVNTPRLFSIPANQQARIQVLTAEPETLKHTLRLTGTVAYNSFHTTPVISPIGGPVTRISATPGQSVRRGQPLLYVASPDYSQLLASYLKAKEAAGLAQKSYARSQDLYQHHAIAQQSLQQSAAANAEAQGDLSASTASLKALGVVNPANLLSSPGSADAAIRAPISGEVVEQSVSPGQLLQAGTTQCFLISNTSTVWVLVNIYQNDLPYVHVGNPVLIQTDSYPQAFHGRISYLAAALDPNTRTLQARIVTRNPGDKLKKGMYVTAVVDAGEIRNAIAVPNVAVLRDSDNQPFVYVESPDGKFGRRMVAAGQAEGGKTQIISGLNPGDRYIANGSLFLQFASSQK